MCHLEMEFARGFLKFKRGTSLKTWGDPYRLLGWHGWVSAESKSESKSGEVFSKSAVLRVKFVSLSDVGLAVSRHNN